MKSRCINENTESYKDYGARGVTVCDEWSNDFGTFQKWALSTGYRDDLSIDQIENDKGYSPENCRWATADEQRNNVLVEIDGVRKTIGQWAHYVEIPKHTLYYRWKKGDRGHDLIRPVAKQRKRLAFEPVSL